MQKYILLVLGATVVFILDQWTKVLAVETLIGSFDAMHFGEDGRVYIPAHRSIPIFDGWWHHRLVGNTGAAFGVFGTLPQSLRIPFFFCDYNHCNLSHALHVSRRRRPKTVRTAITLILGGAVGNLYDRLQHSFVVDFIDWFIPCQSPIVGREPL